MLRFESVTFIRDEKGEVVMMIGSPRTLRRIKADFKYKRTAFYQIKDAVADCTFHIHEGISELEVNEFFDDMDRILTDLGGLPPRMHNSNV